MTRDIDGLNDEMQAAGVRIPRTAEESGSPPDSARHPICGIGNRSSIHFCHRGASCSTAACAWSPYR